MKWNLSGILVQTEIIKALNEQKKDCNPCRGRDVTRNDSENIRCLTMALPKGKVRGAGGAQNPEGHVSNANKFKPVIIGAIKEICQISVGLEGRQGNPRALGAS